MRNFLKFKSSKTSSSKLTWFHGFSGLALVASFGCVSLKSQVENDPSFLQPSGNRIFIQVRNSEGKDLNQTIFAKTVISEATKWLVPRGFKVVDQPKQADTYLSFGFDQKTKRVYVPAQTYSVPIYGNLSGSSTTVKSAYGENLGTLETSASNPYAPTGYQTQYREGYTADLTDRWLFVAVWAQYHGKPPVLVSKGQVYPHNRGDQFFENKQVMSQAVSKLLVQSPLGNVQRAPASVVEEPGCWPRLGLDFDANLKLERGLKIKDFAPGSLAQKAGLKIGDVVYSIAGKDLSLNESIPMSENNPVSIVAKRGTKEFRVEVLPAIFCVED